MNPKPTVIVRMRENRSNADLSAGSTPVALILITLRGIVMDQSTVTQPPARAKSAPGNPPRIAFIQAGWHRPIVSQAYSGFVEECGLEGLSPSAIDLFEVPGSLEIPLQARLLAKHRNYAVIVAAGLIVDGGIYRHDFVAATVLDAMMQVQLEFELPILSVVLTPHQFQESGHRKNLSAQGPLLCPPPFVFRRQNIFSGRAANCHAKYWWLGTFSLSV